MNYKVCLIILTSFLFFLSKNIFAQSQINIQNLTLKEQSARAYNQSGKLLYNEKHKIYFSKDTLVKSETSYFDPEGKLFATLNSDYTLSLTTPTYIFHDFERKHKEGLRKDRENYVIFSQDGANTEKIKILKKKADIFSCQGWHYYILENFNLLEKNKLDFSLVIPEQLDYLNVELSQVEKTKDELHLRLSAKNWFLRMFVPKIEIFYDIKSKKLLRYEGPSNILDSNGDIQIATIQYD